MKKPMLILLSLLLCLGVFAACGGQPTAKHSDITVTLAAPDNNVKTVEKVSTDCENLADLLDELKTAGKLSFTAEDGQWGKYYTSVNGYTPNAAAGEFVAISLKGKTDADFTSAMTGASGIELQTGASYKLWIDVFTAEPDKAFNDITVILYASEANAVTEANISTDCENLADLLDELKTAGKISFTAEDGQWGKYYTSINGYTPDAAAGEFIAISVKEKTDADFTSAMTGASGIELQTGASYKLWIDVFTAG